MAKPPVIGEYQNTARTEGCGGSGQNSKRNGAFLMVAYQTYKFRASDGALIVSGQSPKMGGSYSVTMAPLA